MTDLRKAAEMALKALEQAKDTVADWGAYASHYFQTKNNLRGDIEEIEKQIIALCQALAQTEQKKEWVGLTDDEIDAYALDEGVTANKAPPWLVKYAKNIEAKLKEKNT